MDEAKAREMLAGDTLTDGGLYNAIQFLSWTPGDEGATLDGNFSADHLEAIVWWMRNAPATNEGRT